VLLVGWTERSFDQEKRVGRLLAAYDPDADTAFVRGIGAISLTDDLWLEGSVGWLTGEAARDAPRVSFLQPFVDCDFVYARLRVHF
jgi:hypothetical protein